MKATERRKAILDILKNEDLPVRGKELALRLGVSRQIIVGDISALKEEDCDIMSTHSGYLLLRNKIAQRIFKLKHTRDETKDELSTIVSLGGTVENVYVWHKVYGRIEAPLGISTHEKIEMFMEGVRSGKSTELMNITGGYHYHTVTADSDDTLNEIEKALCEKGYIVPEKQ